MFNLYICRFLNIDFKLHCSFIACFLLFFAYGFINNDFTYFLNFNLIFLFVLLHELGHSLQAIRCGYKCDNITLYSIGGAAAIKMDNFNKTINGLKIILAGPLVSLFFCVLFYLKVIIFGTDYFTAICLNINLMLTLFNIIPIGNLDGGRALLYFLCQKTYFVLATQIKDLICLVLILLFLLNKTFNFNLLFNEYFNIYTFFVVFLLLSVSKLEDYLFLKNNQIFSINYDILKTSKKKFKNYDKIIFDLIEYSNFCMYFLQNKMHFTNSSELASYTEKNFNYIDLMSSGDPKFAELFTEFFNSKNEFLRLDVVEKIVQYKLESKKNNE